MPRQRSCTNTLSSAHFVAVVYPSSSPIESFTSRVSFREASISVIGRFKSCAMRAGASASVSCKFSSASMEAGRSSRRVRRDFFGKHRAACGLCAERIEHDTAAECPHVGLIAHDKSIAGERDHPFIGNQLNEAA